MAMREFVPPRHAIQAQAAIDIAAAPELVAAVYRHVEKWGETFPATIEQAQVTATGDNWRQVRGFFSPKPQTGVKKDKGKHVQTQEDFHDHLPQRSALGME